MKTIFALLTFSLLAWAGRGAAAQESLNVPAAEELPGTISEPLSDAAAAPEAPSFNEASSADPGSLPESLTTDGESISAGMTPKAVEAAESDSPLGDVWNDKSTRYFDACPPLFESSGTWLRRGYWFGEFDYVLLNRSWDRHGLELMNEAIVGSRDNLGGLGRFVIASNVLTISGGKPGAEGMGRVTVGRFLFRDASNRDHVTQATWFGGGNFSQQAALTADDQTGGLNENDDVSRGNRSFEGAQNASFKYDSKFDSLEWNYLVKQRMQKDRLELRPNGDWVRTATPSRSTSFLAGGRFLNLSEALNYQASGIITNSTVTPNTRGDGFHQIDTVNNLIGTQVGMSAAFETARWSLGFDSKAGAYFDRMDMNVVRVVPGLTAAAGVTPANDAIANVIENNLAFVGETQVVGKWHLRPNVSLRAGIEVMYISGVALAPHQLNYRPGGQNQIVATGDALYFGSVLGVEWYR